VNVFPVVIKGESIRALVVGGGEVAGRKIDSLLRAGARVHVVAPQLAPLAKSFADGNSITWTSSDYSTGIIRDVNLVFAATDNKEVNARVVRDARAAGLMVNIASDSSAGDFFTTAVHRDGPLLISVFAGGVPAAAARIRDFIATQLGRKLGGAVALLYRLRRTRLDAGRSTEWQEASRELIGKDFVASVENGEFEKRVASWR
jgi:siroheme synthase-like protein